VPLTEGQQLLHYRLLGPLGEGGMGVVWRALDTSLDREVAIKFLPDAVAADPERLARFDREARLLAALNHPHVAGVYGLHEAGGIRFLAMELVAGEDLSARLARGPLAVAEALRVGRQIADGLEAAHERGIVHRDLKPGNVRLDAEGNAKVLDFGLAKGMEATASGEMSNSPTLTSAGTMAGMILGTAAYMSPEQAAGQAIDRRCDVWSFGVVLHEMLTGRRMFEAESISHTLADVLRAKVDLSDMPPTTPPAVRQLIGRCLVRDRRRRLRDLGEARIALEDAIADPSAGAESAKTPVSITKTPWLPWAVAAVALAVAVAALVWGRRAAERAPEPTLRFSVEMPNEATQRVGSGTQIGITPDGRNIVTSRVQRTGRGLQVRALDRFEPRFLEGTQGAATPVVSPDGEWLAYSMSSGLHKIRLSGGPTSLVGTMPSSVYGLSWGADDFLYYASGGKLFRIPAAGGESEVLNPDGKEALAYPELLPGGRTVLCTAGNDFAAGRLALFDLATRNLRDLGVAGGDGRYLPTGHLLYASGSSAFAVPFDLAELAVTGSPTPVLPRVWVDQGQLQLAVAADGTVAYLPVAPGGEGPKLVTVDLAGKVEPLLSQPLPFQAFSDPRFSHDGRRLILSPDNGSLWMVDLDSQTPTLMSEDGFYPFWSPDDREIIYGKNKTVPFQIYRRPVDLSRPEQLVLGLANNLRPGDWTRQGIVIYREEIPGKGMDLRTMTDVDDPSTVKPLLEGPDDELAPTVSPDGRWLAFVSNYSGSDEIYVTTFPQPGGRVQISSRGGDSPVWAPDGKTLYYFDGTALDAVSLETSPRLKVTGRRKIIEGDFVTYRWSRQYDIDPSGRRFVMIQTPNRSNVEVIRNWFAELRATQR